MIEKNKTIIIKTVAYLTFSYINLLANILGQKGSNIIITDRKYLRLIILVFPSLYISRSNELSISTTYKHNQN